MMAIVQPGNQAFYGVMSRGWELKARQESVMKAVAVIGIDGDNLVIREVSGSLNGNHINGLTVGDKKTIKLAELPRLAEGKLIILHGDPSEAEGSWTIVDNKLVPEKFADDEVVSRNYINM